MKKWRGFFTPKLSPSRKTPKSPSEHSAPLIPSPVGRTRSRPGTKNARRSARPAPRGASAKPGRRTRAPLGAPPQTPQGGAAPLDPPLGPVAPDPGPKQTQPPYPVPPVPGHRRPSRLVFFGPPLNPKARGPKKTCPSTARAKGKARQTIKPVLLGQEGAGSTKNGETASFGQEAWRAPPGTTPPPTAPASRRRPSPKRGGKGKNTMLENHTQTTKNLAG